jgi:hypothetical protein
MDVQAIAAISMKLFPTRVARQRSGGSPTLSDEEMAELNRLLAKLPSEPDEKLR